MTICIVNMKAYDGCYGAKGLELGLELQRVAGDYSSETILAVGAPDIRLFTGNLSIPIYAQHVDPFTPGGHTGAVLANTAALAGASGTLINHSERRMTLADIEASLGAARSVGLATVICSNNVEASAAAAVLGPDRIAMEPPELIGGDISVTSASPEVISSTVTRVSAVAPEVGILCGAGVKDGTDAAKAIGLGTEGVLVASGIVRAADPGQALADILAGMES